MLKKFLSEILMDLSSFSQWKVAKNLKSLSISCVGIIYSRCLHSCCVRPVSTPETINNCTGAPYQPTPTTPSEASYYNSIGEALYHHHFWDHVHKHQRDSGNTMHVSITLLITTNDQTKCHRSRNKDVYQQLVIILHISVLEVAGECLQNCATQQDLLQIFHHKDPSFPINQSQILIIFIQFQLNTRTHQAQMTTKYTYHWSILDLYHQKEKSLSIT